jgi:hypothetical protein
MSHSLSSPGSLWIRILVRVEKLLSCFLVLGWTFTRCFGFGILHHGPSIAVVSEVSSVVVYVWVQVGELDFHGRLRGAFHLFVLSCESCVYALRCYDRPLCGHDADALLVDTHALCG